MTVEEASCHYLLDREKLSCQDHTEQQLVEKRLKFRDTETLEPKSSLLKLDCLQLFLSHPKMLVCSNYWKRR